MKKRHFSTRSFPLTGKALARLRFNTIRRGTWFKSLCRNERNLLELTIRVTNRVKSLILANLLLEIVEKLLLSLQGQVALLSGTIGITIARQISNIARRWGNKLASKWADDPLFIRYLAIMRMNNPLIT